MLRILQMRKTHIAEAIQLWGAQFITYCLGPAFPNFYAGGKHIIEAYLLERISSGNAIVAMEDNTLVGYMAWMNFDFHAERTAFIPIVGSAASLINEDKILHEMYVVSSEKWVRDNRFNHLWMIYDDDTGLKNTLYDLGFGSYVFDACQRTDQFELLPTSYWRVTQACDDDIDAVLALENDSENTLLKTPVFLVRNPWKREDVAKLLASEQVFLAWDKNHITGMVSVDINRDYHFEHLTCADSAGGTCCYVRPEYRRKGIGSALLRKAFAYCHRAQKPFLHVSFETSNPNAINFWPKYFKPAIRSVRRTVNKDANLAL